MGDLLKPIGVNSFCKFMMDDKAIARCIFAPNIVARIVERCYIFDGFRKCFTSA